MKRKLAGLFLGMFALTFVACGGGGGGGGYSPPAGGGGSTPSNPTPPPVTPNTISMAIPDDNIGTVNTAPWGTVGGYTQNLYSQVLAYAPGTVVTLKNAGAQAHTLNVLSTSAFPTNPSLSTTASGGSSVGATYASGSIAVGGSVSVTLANAGTYYIGCAYHYNDPVSMRDVLQVSSSATPGPQATPNNNGGVGGTSPPSCVGYYC